MQWDMKIEEWNKDRSLDKSLEEKVKDTFLIKTTVQDPKTHTQCKYDCLSRQGGAWALCWEHSGCILVVKVFETDHLILTQTEQYEIMVFTHIWNCFTLINGLDTSSSSDLSVLCVCFISLSVYFRLPPRNTATLTFLPSSQECGDTSKTPTRERSSDRRVQQTLKLRKPTSVWPTRGTNKFQFCNFRPVFPMCNREWSSVEGAKTSWKKPWQRIRQVHIKNLDLMF